MNDFDMMGRAVVKEDPHGEIGWMLPRLHPQRGFGGWLDPQSAPRPGEADRRCDTIAALIDKEGKNEPIACVIELFTGPDADALDRAMEYVGRFRRELRHGPYGHDKYPFVVVLLFLTGTPGVTRLASSVPGMKEVGLWFGPRIMDLSAVSAVAHLNAIAQNKLPRSLLAWLSLMQGGQSAEFVARWRAQAELEPDVNRRSLMVDAAKLFAEKTKSAEVWTKGLEGMNVEESIWGRQMRANAERTRLQRLTLTALTTRFPDGIPPHLRERVERETDADVLERWIVLATTGTPFETILKD